MNIAANILLVFSILLFALSFTMLVRNMFVYRYRGRLLEEVSDAAKHDIRAGKDYVWRYEAYSSVGYDTMMWRFWRKLDSFYPDKSFIDPEVTREKDRS